jgi:hypothetical protein
MHSCPDHPSASASACAEWFAICNSEELTNLYNGPSLHTMYDNILGPHTSLPQCTWVRAKGQNDPTVPHVDYYYFRHNTKIFSDYWNSSTSHDHTNIDNTYCQICNKYMNLNNELVLQCDICKQLSHRSCVKKQKQIIKKEANEEWHCERCADSNFDYFTCWIALVRAVFI